MQVRAIYGSPVYQSFHGCYHSGFSTHLCRPLRECRCNPEEHVSRRGHDFGWVDDASSAQLDPRYAETLMKRINLMEGLQGQRWVDLLASKIGKVQAKCYSVCNDLNRSQG